MPHKLNKRIFSCLAEVVQQHHNAPNQSVCTIGAFP